MDDFKKIMMFFEELNNTSKVLTKLTNEWMEIINNPIKLIFMSKRLEEIQFAIQIKLGSLNQFMECLTKEEDK